MKKKLFAAATAAVMMLSCAVAAIPEGTGGLLDGFLIAASAADADFSTAALTATTVSITGCTLSGDVTIPSTIGGKTVTAIAANAFYNNANVTAVIVPSTVTAIGANAFNNTTALKKLVVLNSSAAITAQSIGYSGTAVNSALVICGYTGSTAQAYASANLMTFSTFSTTLGDITATANYSSFLTTGLWASNGKINGDIIQLYALVDDSTANAVIWTSENTAQLTINQLAATDSSTTGKDCANVEILAQGKGDGTCKIYARTADGALVKSIELTLKQPADSGAVTYNDTPITEIYSTLYVDIGETCILYGALAYSGGAFDDTAGWFVPSEELVTCAGDGAGNIYVTGVKIGTGTFTYTSRSGRVNYHITMYVLDKADSVEIYVGKTEITGSGTNVVANHSLTLTTKFNPRTSTDTVTWTSSNPSIAEVSADGVVTGKAAGMTTLTAALTDTPNDPMRHETYSTTRITVIANPPATQLEFYNKPDGTAFTEREVLAGDVLSCGALATDEYYLKKTPVDTNNTIYWSSSNTSIATVDDIGTITAKSGGTVVITAMAESGIYAQMTLDVKVRVASMTANFLSKTMAKGSAAELAAVTTPSTATEPITWRSSDESLVKIVTTSDGKTYVDTNTGNTKIGTAVITGTATLSGVQTTCSVTVKAAVPTTALAVAPVSGTYQSYTGSDNLTHYIVSKDDELVFNAVITPAESTDQIYAIKITENIKKPHIDYVVEGKKITVTGLLAGTDQLIVRAYYDSIKTKIENGVTIIYFEPTEMGTATISVDVQLPITSIVLAGGYTESSMNKDTTYKITTTILPSGYTDKLEWTSENLAYATVSEDGTVTALKTTQDLDKGYVTITCKPYYTLPGSDTRYYRGVTDTLNVKITNPTESITVSDSAGNLILDGSTVYLKAGTKLTVTGTGDKADTSDTFSATTSASSTLSLTSTSTTKNVITTTLNGLKAGTVTVAVKASNGVQVSFTVVVYTMASSVSLNTASATINLGTTTTQLTATLGAVAGVTATEPILWQSSDTTAVSFTVTSNTAIKLSAFKTGTVTITATTLFSGYSASAQITVKAPATAVSFSPDTLTMGRGETQTMLPTVTTAISGVTSTDVLTWKSSDESVATVDATGAVHAVKLGTAKITATADSGKSDYYTVTVNTGLSDITIAAIPDQTYTGSALKPKLTLTDGYAALATTSYAAVYTDNTNVGTATVTITGKGSYTGTATVTFKIINADFAATAIKPAPYSGTYDGKAHTASVKASGTAAGATITYSKDNKTFTATAPTFTNAGTYTVYYKVTKDNYNPAAGSTTVTIAKKAFTSSYRAALTSTTKLIYKGTALKPTIKVTYSTTTLKLNTDYTVTYSANNAIGTATVTVTGKGNYSGTIKTTFVIYPGKTASLKATAGSKSATLKWSKVTGISGYDIKRSTSKTSGFTTIKSVSSSTISYKVTGLAKGKTYYFQLIAYKTVSGKKVYGDPVLVSVKAK
ncbi:MAG: Ig-like domain-containing protein [Oscillospiraceae bacterium]